MRDTAALAWLPLSEACALLVTTINTRFPAVHGATLPLPVSKGKRRKESTYDAGDNGSNERDGADASRKKMRKSRRTGLLAKEGPLVIA